MAVEAKNHNADGVQGIDVQLKEIHFSPGVRPRLHSLDSNQHTTEASALKVWNM